MYTVIVVGAGPAGLMAAEVLSAAGVAVQVFDAMPSVGRKFLLAGKGGLNLTHSEPIDLFVTRYGPRHQEIGNILQAFGPGDVRDWASSLGIATFVGSSGRVFPQDMKAAPLLRAWLQRLRHPKSDVAVKFMMRQRWTGWCSDDSKSATGQTDNGNPNTHLCFDAAAGSTRSQADAVILALGGGSWARLGSNGAWVPWLKGRGVTVSPLLPSNCGFDVLLQMPSSSQSSPVKSGWSDYLATRFAGQPLKSVAIQFSNSQGVSFQRKGEFVLTATGVEGSLIYAVSSLLRDEIMATGRATFYLDLLPDMSMQRVQAEVCHPRGSRSLTNHLKSRLHLDGIKSALLHELLSKSQLNDSIALATAIKAWPVTLLATRPIDEAISSAGGVMFEGMDQNLMLKQLPGVFCAGEMLDWEAPTGGYLLTACLASGKKAAAGVLSYLHRQ